MDEKELDSSTNEYIEGTNPTGYIKQQGWNMVIGLQEVDNLKPSKYLEKLINALVRSNYFNNYLKIKEDSSYLIKFYENLLLGKNNNLHSSDLIVKELFYFL